MFGIRFVKVQPTTYLIQYRDGKAVREGVGRSFFYYSPTSSIVAVPLASRSLDFIFEHVTSDFQTVTVQGHVTYRIAEPKKTAALLNFTLKPNGRGYETDDPEKLAERILALTEVLAQQEIQQRALKEALQSAERVSAAMTTGVSSHPDTQSLGVQILGVVIVAIKPTPETARALETQAREAILKAADEAIFERRNAAVENERQIRESELDTEVAVEQKKRAIRETQLEAEASVRRKKAELRQADMESDIVLEERRKAFVEINAANTRTIAEAEAHRVAATMQALERSDPRVVQALANVGMQPGQLIAQAFGGIAERAERIGQLNMSPELLQSLLKAPNTEEASHGNKR